MLHIFRNIAYLVILLVMTMIVINSSAAFADTKLSSPNETYFSNLTCGGGKDQYGNNYSQFTTVIDFGCEGKGPAILDLIFGVIKFLTDGVGLVVVASIIYAGIQYIVSTGDPQATATAVKRIRSSIVALLLFIFAYAILNYVVPGAVLQ